MNSSSKREGGMREGVVREGILSERASERRGGGEKRSGNAITCRRAYLLLRSSNSSKNDSSKGAISRFRLRG